MKEGQLFAWGLLTAVSCCWAANTIFARLAVGEISPMWLVALRWAGALLVIAVIARRSLRADWPVLRAHLPLLLLLGAVGFTAFNSLFYVAAHFTTAINMAIFQGSIPVFVLLGLVLTERRGAGNPGLRRTMGVSMTLLGVIWVAVRGEPALLADTGINPGDALILLACIIYAGYTLWLRRRPAVSALSQFAVMTAGAFAAAIPLVIIEQVTMDPELPTPTGLAIAVATVIFPSLIAQTWFIRGVEMIGPARAGVFVNLVPVLASGFAVIFLNETFASYHLVALVLVLGGIALSETARTPLPQASD